MVGEQVYLRQECYHALQVLMANTPRRTSFPVSAPHAEGLYYTRVEHEIETPACIILLSHREWDERHVKLLSSLDGVTLRRDPARPGWWTIVDVIGA